MKTKELDKTVLIGILLFLGIIFIFDGLYDFETRWIEILIGACFVSLGLVYLNNKRKVECTEIVKNKTKKKHKK